MILIGFGGIVEQVLLLGLEPGDRGSMGSIHPPDFGTALDPWDRGLDWST